MSENQLLTFQEALNEACEQDRYLLLGNGFSVSWNPTIFSYKSLKESASSLKESTKELFLKLNTVDFEEVIKAYEHAADVCEVARKPNKKAPIRELFRWQPQRDSNPCTHRERVVSQATRR